MGPALSALLAVFGVLITVSTVYASYRVTRNTQATAIYRTTAEGWQAQSELQERQISELKADSARQISELTAREASKDQKIADLTARVEVLQDMVTGKSMLEAHHRAFEAKAAELLTMAAETRSEVRAMHATMTAGNVT